MIESGAVNAEKPDPMLKASLSRALSVCLSAWLPGCLAAWLPGCLSVCPSLSFALSLSLSLCSLSSTAFLGLFAVSKLLP